MTFATVAVPAGQQEGWARDALPATATGRTVEGGEVAGQFVGRPATHLELGVADERGGAVADGVVGHIRTRGRAPPPLPYCCPYPCPYCTLTHGMRNDLRPHVMAEYLNQPGRTARALQGGWLDTGDLGFFSGGGLYFVSRTSDRVNTGGVKVRPPPPVS